jgi:hypothetical protein
MRRIIVWKASRTLPVFRMEFKWVVLHDANEDCVHTLQVRVVSITLATSAVKLASGSVHPVLVTDWHQFGEHEVPVQYAWMG